MEKIDRFINYSIIAMIGLELIAVIAGEWHHTLFLVGLSVLLGVKLYQEKKEANNGK